MTTVRQIERLWNAKDYGRLFRELSACRPEGRMPIGVDVRGPLAAALAVIRMDELAQGHVPLCGRLIRAIIAIQDNDGGWGDAITTAFCLRALLCGGGQGASIERGMIWLADLQKEEGAWPLVPIRRMDADAHTTVLVLSQLADQAMFQRTVHLDAAVDWFARHADQLDDKTADLWSQIRFRCRIKPAAAPKVPETIWARVA